MTWNDIEAAVGAEDQKFLVVDGTVQVKVNGTMKIDPATLADAMRSYGSLTELLPENLRSHGWASFKNDS